MKRKICVVTGTRAEYGLLQWLMREIKSDPKLELQVAVTGMHLAPEYGLTYRQIEDDGFEISARVENQLSSDTHVGMAKSTGLAVLGFADAFDRLKPDLVAVLGDRYEIFAAAQVAALMRIPLAHLHGGEITEGAVDESLRHAITKLSHLHFVSAEPYRNRVVQMGEDPARVFNVGAFGVDSILKLKLLDRAALNKELGLPLSETNFLVTYHPVTLDRQGPAAAMRELFKALDKFPEVRVVFTKPNSDAGGREISTLIDEYAAKNAARVAAHTSLGQLKYLSAMKHASVVIGNSSSGILEAGYLQVPTVDIGSRQKGRLAPASVIHCEDRAGEIESAIRRAIDSQFRKNLASMKMPFGSGDASVKTKKVLAEFDLSLLSGKKFHDIEVS